MKRFHIITLVLALCSARSELPPLIPREIMFANPARTDPKVSPDGSQLSWLAPYERNVLNVWTGALDGGNAHCVTHERGDPLEWYGGSGNGTQILNLHGDVDEENTLLVLAG